MIFWVIFGVNCRKYFPWQFFLFHYHWTWQFVRHLLNSNFSACWWNEENDLNHEDIINHERLIHSLFLWRIIVVSFIKTCTNLTDLRLLLSDLRFFYPTSVLNYIQLIGEKKTETVLFTFFWSYSISFLTTLFNVKWLQNYCEQNHEFIFQRKHQWRCFQYFRSYVVMLLYENWKLSYHPSLDITISFIVHSFWKTKKCSTMVSIKKRSDNFCILIR